MREFILILCFFLVGCEKFTTEVSDLTLSGKYVVSKLTVIQTSQPISQDTTYLSGQVFINHNLPAPFDSIKIDNFHIHFDYSSVRMVWYNRLQHGQRDRWEYGETPNEIFYHRVPWSFDAYTLGKIQFEYKPKNQSTYRKVLLQVDSDLFETLQLSGLEFAPYGKYGPHYRLILTLNRIGP